MPHCGNCEEFVTDAYGRVFAPSELSTVRVCPSREDMVREVLLIILLDSSLLAVLRRFGITGLRVSLGGSRDGKLFSGAEQALLAIGR